MYEILALIIAAAALLVTAFQVYSSSQTVKASAYSDLMGQLVEINRVIFEYNAIYSDLDKAAQQIYN